MKVIGWNKYSGVLDNGKQYQGYFVYAGEPIPENIEGDGQRVVVFKVRGASPAFQDVPALQLGDNIDVDYDQRGNVKRINVIA